MVQNEKRKKKEIESKMCIICRFRSGEEKDISNLSVLECKGCTTLISLPDLSGLVNLTQLYCSGCTSLTSLPDLSGLVNLSWLDCSGCTSLTSLPDLSGLVNLERLYCGGCTSLTSLPDLSGLVNLEGIVCSGCTSLTSLPTLSGLEWLECDGCTWLEYNPYFNGNVQKLVLLQRNLRKFCFRRRLNKRYYLKKFLYTDLVKMVLTF